MKRLFFMLNFLIVLCCVTPNLQAQVFLYDDCFDGDFGGITTADNPDLLAFGDISPDELVFEIEGCLFPAEVDYYDLFTFFVPEGYVLEAIQFGYVTHGNPTELDFSFWLGDNCVPWDSPNLTVEDVPLNGPEDPWGSNVISGMGPLASGYYSIRLDTDGWPTGTRYEIFFTLSCDDNTAPAFTTAPGALDATLNCSDLAAIDAALNMEPEGDDNSGSVSLVLTNDQTTPDPGCPNAYIRTRTWTLEDGCGNSSAQSYTQTIAVYDDTPPAFTMVAGALDVVLECDDAAGLVNALAMTPTGADACGSASLELIADVTTPDPGCSKAFNRVRTWRLVDACGNQSLAVFNQSIQVQDNTPPVAVAANGVIAISDPDGYVLEPADVLNLGATFDACGEITVAISPEVLGCDLLGQVVPVTVTVTDECGNSTEVIAMIEVTEDTSIKAPWDNDNIGVTANGSATHSPCEGAYYVTSSGFSIPNSDVAHFVYVDLCGDGEIIARVNNVNPNTGWGGVMIRESLQPGARKVALKTGLNNTIRREIRTTANMNSQMQQSAVLPGAVWFRISRTGNTYNLYSSSNGTQWQFVGSAQLNTGNCVLMGIYTESTNNNTAVTSIFDEVSVSGGVQPLVVLPDQDGLIDAANLVSLSPVPTAYPNPGKGNFYIDLSPYSGLNVTMEVTDLNGQLLLTRQIAAGKTPETLSLIHYPAGMYLVRIQPEAGSPHVLKLLLK
ncbi:MAG: T9SS type A sorting domain-containing protein [Saprospiraceae bacterium]|nr:T9SS type A sorting domain-containing protein [Saprospiraceae bacterium]